MRNFSTRDYPATERAKIWREHLQDWLFDAAYREFSGDGLVAEHSGLILEDSRAHTFAINEHMIDRADPEASKPAGSTVFFTTVVTGRAMYWSASRMEIAGPGDTLVYDPNDPFFLSFHKDSRILLLEIPRDGIAGQIDWGAHSCIRLVQGEEGNVGGSAQTFRGVYSELSRRSVNDLRLRDDIERMTTSLRRSALEVLAPGYYSQAVEFIDSQLMDQGLSVESVARFANVSSRHLNRVFRSYGTSVSRHITRRRMKLAGDLLAPGTLSVEQVALQCGYNSASYFSRAFTLHTGKSPSQFRRDAASSSLGVAEPSSRAGASGVFK